VFDRGFFLTLQAIRRQLAGMPNDFYFIRLIHGSTHRPAPGERLWTAAELMRGTVVRFLRERNHEGFNVYLWPYGGHCNAGYILLDLDQASPRLLEAMRANGHEPCVVLETSPGHLQAWVRVSTTGLEPKLATTLGRQLAQTYGGDLASTDWRHLGRLAGFTNQKPQRRTVSGSAPWVRVVEARAILASAAQGLLHSATQAVAQHLTASVSYLIWPCLQVSNPTTMTVQGAARIYRRWMERWRIQNRFSRVDWSVVDLWLARKLLAMHISPAQAEAIIRLGSPGFPRHHGDPEDYLQRTLARAALPFPRPVCSIHPILPAVPRAPIDQRCMDPHRH
jgi:RepB DNA-primase from phage plasmid